MGKPPPARARSRGEGDGKARDGTRRHGGGAARNGTAVSCAGTYRARPGSVRGQTPQAMALRHGKARPCASPAAADGSGGRARHGEGVLAAPRGVIRHEGDARRVVPSPGDGTLRLVSANPEYRRVADDVRIVGKVLWKATRV